MKGQEEGTESVRKVFGRYKREQQRYKGAAGWYKWVLGRLKEARGKRSMHLNPCPAEPGYTLPLQTV